MQPAEEAAKGWVAGGGRCTHEQKDHRVTRGLQARVPSKHATYRNRTAVQCVERSGDKRPQQKGSSLKQYPQSWADRRAVPLLHVHTGRARAPTGRRQAHKQGCAVQCAEMPRRCGPAFRMPVAQMQAAPRSSAKKLATKIAGAKALERARRGGCCREERKAACTRHGEPARARPRPHRLEGGREEGGGGKGVSRLVHARTEESLERLNVGFDT